jgi:hypothetical protein
MNAKCWWCEEEHAPNCKALLEAHAKLGSAYAKQNGQLGLLENELVKLRRVLSDTLEMVHAKS